jgi:Ni/Co efflux regulator RcnB
MTQKFSTKLLTGALIGAMLLPVAASAQSRGELRRDRQEIRQQERQLDRARASGDRRDVREQREDVREARREYREDWQDYRQRNRQLYRGSRFDAPFRYRSFGVGNRIGTPYYGSAYRVNNVQRWRLPLAARNQQYVRHYNDLLLINTRNGTVVRVYRNFYW